MTDRGRLAEILGACGANPARWPDAERAEAQALLAHDAGLQAQAAREAVLDDWLKDWEVPAPRPQAVAALLAASRGTSQAAGQANVQAVVMTPAPARRRERWLANGGAVGLAASIVALLMVAAEPAPAPPAPMEVADASVVSLAFSTEFSEGWL